MAGEKVGFFKKLFQYGELPTLDTTVSIDNNSVLAIGSVVFIVAFLIFLTVYTFKKIS